MDLTQTYIHQTSHSNPSSNDRARTCCLIAKEYQESGNYEAAREAIGEWWQDVGRRPQLQDLDELARAELLMRAGAISGFIGSAKQIEGTQESAKNLISESVSLFEALHETEKTTEALTELAYCYWREGSYDEARITLHQAMPRLVECSPRQQAATLLRLAIVESSATRYNDALRILTEAAPLFAASDNHAKKGTFHMELAIVLKFLSEGEHREDYVDRALIDFAAASFHFEQAGHTTYRASVENNFGYFLFTKARYQEAHEHLDCARRLFVNLKDSVHTAQVDETCARVLLAQGSIAEAEQVVSAAVQTLENGGQQGLLAEALTTWGTALARLGKRGEARKILQRAFEVAEQAGDLEGAGVAELATLEELGEHLTSVELRAVYELADHLSLIHISEPTRPY